MANTKKKRASRRAASSPDGGQERSPAASRRRRAKAKASGKGQSRAEHEPARPAVAAIAAAQAAAVCERLEADGARWAKIGGFDLDGVLRGKYVSPTKLRSALEKGFGFCDVIFGWDVADMLYDNSRVTGWHTGYPDVHAVLDPDTARSSPWEPGVVSMLCDFRDAQGKPHPACPRSLLKRVRDRARDMGYEASFGAEFEFLFFRETRDTLADKGYRGLTPLDPGMMGYSWVRTGQDADLMRDILDTLAAHDIELEGLHTETGPGVYEAAIRHDEVLRAADKAALFKTALKQIAPRHGLSVTFMAKNSVDLPGSSGHLHQSLWQDGVNVFGRGKRGALAPPLRHYLGGQMALSRELTALMSPTINSYKRYVPGLWAPLSPSWAVDNRTCSLRVIEPGSRSAARVECRQGAADINPYVAMAACLGAGLWGIEHELDPGEPMRGDAGSGDSPFPNSLDAATTLLERSGPAKRIFGAEFIDHYVRTRRWEVREFQRAVTDWEARRYFEMV